MLHHFHGQYSVIFSSSPLRPRSHHESICTTISKHVLELPSYPSGLSSRPPSLIPHPNREARIAQTGLMEIAESIEMVRSDHDKLERHNLALQDYIGGLTKSMAKGDVSGKSKK